MRNPIGVKLGPTTTPQDMLELVDKLEPNREPGRLTLITRMGAEQVRDALPPLLETVKASDARCRCGSPTRCTATGYTPTGYKTRRFDDVVDEVKGFFEAHRASAPTPAAFTSS